MRPRCDEPRHPPGRRHRLQWQIFKALLLTGLLCIATAALIAWLLRDDVGHMPEVVRDIAGFVVDELPQDDPAAFRRGLRRRAHRLRASISVWDERGRLLARAGRPLPAPGAKQRLRAFRDPRHGALVQLEDGRSVAIALDEPARLRPAHWGIPVVILMVALLLGSHWAATRIARRLASLEASVARFGEGDLSVRAGEHGDDEIGRLSRAFNRSAERIASLVQTQRRMLQSASHELRSPLARLRMAIELLRDGGDERAREKLSADAERDIGELDELIDELLLAARLEDSALPREHVRVDLTALVKAEAERAGVSAALAPVEVTGNPRMLKSLSRNLIENAKRYGAPPIEVRLAREGDEVVLTVDDAGNGVPEADHARIFEPFYRALGTREGQGGGVGLGLSLVRRVARHHGGDVRYIAKGAGARFEARWPVSPRDTRAARAC